MKDITIKEVIEDLRFGLEDILRKIMRGESNKLFETPEHHLSLGVLMVSIALLISITRV